MNGFIYLHRDIRNNWLWLDKPFDKRSAWIDILFSCNHQDNKFMLGNELVFVEQGSFITSELKLMDRWGWSKTKVRSFLALLEKEEMIIKKSDKKKTTLTVVNYKRYQFKETTEKPQEDHRETTERPHKNTNNNVNKENKDNKDNKKDVYSDFIQALVNIYPGKKTKAVRDKKLPKIIKEYGEEQVKKCVERYALEVRGKTEFILNESTFWNSRYIDYLDENYTPIKEVNSYGNFTGNDSTKPKYDTEKYNWTGSPD